MRSGSVRIRVAHLAVIVAALHAIALCPPTPAHAQTAQVFEPVEGFPLDFTQFLEGSDIDGGIAIEDVAGDGGGGGAGGEGRREIVFGATDGMVHLIDASGEERRDGLWPRHLPAPIVGPVKVAPLGEDGQARIVVPCMDGRIYCLSREGDILWGRDTGAPDMEGTPVVTPLEAGGMASIVYRCPQGDIDAVAPDGQLEWSYCPSGPGSQDVAVIDPASDGHRQVLAKDDLGVHTLLDAAGRPTLTWPAPHDADAPRPTATVTLDLDGSGRLSYVSESPRSLDVDAHLGFSLAPTFDDYNVPPHTVDDLYEWDPSGAMAARIPKPLGRCLDGLTSGDLAHTGRPQLAWSDDLGSVNVIDLEGKPMPGWPRRLEETLLDTHDAEVSSSPEPLGNKPMIVDVAGQGSPQLVVGVNDRNGEGPYAGMLVALDAHGKCLPEGLVPIGRNRAPPAICDLMGDGTQVLVVAGGIGGTGPQLYAFRLRARRALTMTVLRTQYTIAGGP